MMMTMMMRSTATTSTTTTTIMIGGVVSVVSVAISLAIRFQILDDEFSQRRSLSHNSYNHKKNEKKTFSMNKTTKINDSTSNSSFQIITTIRYLGGDGKTMLTGRLFHPPAQQRPSRITNSIVDTSSSSNDNNINKNKDDVIEKKNTTPSKQAPSSSSSPRPPSVIVLVHGFGLIQNFPYVEPYVKAFLDAEYAVMTFDFSTFGDSDGYPRHQVKPLRQLEDIKATLQMLKQHSDELNINVTTNANPNTTNDTNTGGVGLWGTSLGGGHVLMIAAHANANNNAASGSTLSSSSSTPTTPSAANKQRHDTNDHDKKDDDDEHDSSSSSSSYDLPTIKAVVAQEPHLRSGFESVIGTIQRNPIIGSIGVIKVIGSILKWTIVSVLSLGKETLYIPITGHPGSASILQNHGDMEGYLSLTTPTKLSTIPNNNAVYYDNNDTTNKVSSWKNLVTVGSVLAILVYRPIKTIVKSWSSSSLSSSLPSTNQHQVVVPSLLIAPEKDTLCPLEASKDVFYKIMSTNTITTTKTTTTGDTATTTPNNNNNSDNNDDYHHHYNHNKNMELLIIPNAGHFDIYHGKMLEDILQKTVSFYKKHL